MKFTSYLFLKAEKHLSIQIQPPVKANCTCQAKALSNTPTENRPDQKQPCRKLSLLRQFFHNSTL